MPNHSRLHLPIILTLGVLAAPGCTPEIHRYMRFPNLFHPGTAAHQRAAAVEHDPFPENDIAPTIVGGRPLGYQAGVLEVDRMTMNAVPPPGVAPTFVPGAPMQPLVGTTYSPTPTYPPPAVGSPFAVPPPVVTTPLPPAPPAQSVPFIQQQRSPY